MSKKRIEESVYRNAAVLLEQKGYIGPVELLVLMDRLKIERSGRLEIQKDSLLRTRYCW